jgi:hypothetical protein
MKPLLITAIGAACLSIGSLIHWFWTSSQEAAATPSESRRGVYIPDPVIEFGRVGLNETVHGSFRVVNDSEHTITIDKVIKSCSCTVGECSVRELPPSGTAEVRFSLKTGAYRGPRAENVGVTYTFGGPVLGPVMAHVLFTPTGVFSMDPPEVTLSRPFTVGLPAIPILFCGLSLVFSRIE